MYVNINNGSKIIYCNAGIALLLIIHNSHLISTCQLKPPLRAQLWDWDYVDSPPSWASANTGVNGQKHPLLSNP